MQLKVKQCLSMVKVRCAFLPAIARTLAEATQNIDNFCLNVFLFLNWNFQLGIM